jgi:prenyl protein peptidase
MGLPKFWGRIGAVEPIMRADKVNKRSDEKQGANTIAFGDESLSVGWTIAYYLLLIIGAYAFYKQLWNLSDGNAPLSEFK